eukprot:CAMPEP_0194050386 /NCGR_PEP_ID=MMETSP0009_2-20130614/35009_1 /TAXON_ID=210454 /ORGANISM="Grammatophora oceanica, Strain CCMP 410" /LENGTH=276 /DNA_ID=CAMNT_0038696989 /DNA_START=17 /DNA_END=847 /DNA_ORIENTATION=+
MLRSALTRPLHHQRWHIPRPSAYSTLRTTPLATTTRRSTTPSATLPHRLASYRRHVPIASLSLPTTKQSRWFAEGGDTSSKQKPPSGQADNDASSTEDALVLTPGQKVAAASRLGMWLGVGALVVTCGYFIARELLPTKMSPNRVFDRATALVRDNSQVQTRFGQPLKAYGRDHGGHREGRRNFIEHTQYTDKDDGSSRTRVRFNLEGPQGRAFCFAEVSSSMPSGEFVYVLVQDKTTGRVITVVDNRAALTAQRLVGASKEGSQVMNTLLGGGKN